MTLWKDIFLSGKNRRPDTAVMNLQPDRCGKLPVRRNIGIRCQVKSRERYLFLRHNTSFYKMNNKHHKYNNLHVPVLYILNSWGYIPYRRCRDPPHNGHDSTVLAFQKTGFPWKRNLHISFPPPILCKARVTYGLWISQDEGRKRRWGRFSHNGS